MARMIGHITYLSPRGDDRRNSRPTGCSRATWPTEFEKKFSVGSYLGYQGDKFVERFDANSYVALSMAMDLFDLGATPAELAAACARAVPLAGRELHERLAVPAATIAGHRQRPDRRQQAR